MSPPRRALFSLNVDSNAEHIYQRVDDHNKQSSDKAKILETTGPTIGNTRLEVLTKPFEKVVDRTVEGVIEGSGKRVKSAEGEVHYETHSSGPREGTGEGSKIVKTRKGHKKDIQEEYDTSDL